MKKTKSRFAICRLNRKVKKFLEKVEIEKEEIYKFEVMEKMGQLPPSIKESAKGYIAGMNQEPFFVHNKGEVEERIECLLDVPASFVFFKTKPRYRHGGHTVF